MILVVDYLNIFTTCKVLFHRPAKTYFVYRNNNEVLEKLYIKVLRSRGISIEKFDQSIGALWRDASRYLDRFVSDSFQKHNPSPQTISPEQFSLLFYNNFAALFFLRFTCKTTLERKNYRILMRRTKKSFSFFEKFQEIEPYFYPNPFSMTKAEVALKFQYWACDGFHLNHYRMIKLLAKIFYHFFTSFFTVTNRCTHFFHLNPIFKNHNSELTKNLAGQCIAMYGNTKNVFRSTEKVSNFFYLSGRDVMEVLKRIWFLFIASNNFNFGARIRLLEVLVDSEIISRTLTARKFKSYYTDFESPVNFFVRRSLENSVVLTLARSRSWGFMDFPTRFGHLWKGADIHFVFSKDHADIFMESGDLSKYHLAIGFPKVAKHNLVCSSITPAVCVVDNNCRNDIYHSEDELGLFIKAVIRCCDKNDLSLRIKAKKMGSVGRKFAASKSISLDTEQGVFPDVNIKTIFIGFGLTTVLQIAARLGYRVLVFDPFNLTPSDLKRKFLGVKFFDKIELLPQLLTRDAYEKFDKSDHLETRESDDECIVRVMRCVSELDVTQDKPLTLQKFSKKFSGSLVSHGVKKSGSS